ncbi:hypothetical protein [Rhodococcus sp. ACPA1]|nr:hypothetical protein [Rhodococcus sp. ACPA1]
MHFHPDGLHNLARALADIEARNNVNPRTGKRTDESGDKTYQDNEKR